jgi:hypothetical protein
MSDLPSLLRGAMQWKNDRPTIDNDALLVIADWCEENDRLDDAQKIRTAMKPIWEQEGREREDRDADVCGYYALNSGINYDVCQYPPRRTYNRVTGHARCLVGSNVTKYEVMEDEIQPKVKKTPQLPTLAGMVRVHDLARWDSVCRMLGYPPVRLLAGD